MREVTVLVAEQEILGVITRYADSYYYGLATYIGDSRKRWRNIYNLHNKGQLAGIAHTHPGREYPTPSQTDIETFSAVERGLGSRVTWWITTLDSLVEIHWDPHQKEYNITQVAKNDEKAVGFGWLDDLRKKALFY